MVWPSERTRNWMLHRAETEVAPCVNLIGFYLLLSVNLRLTEYAYLNIAEASGEWGIAEAPTHSNI